MRLPTFYDGQFVSASAENDAFSAVSAGIAEFASTIFSPGMAGLSSATFSTSGMVLTCNMAGTAALFSSGVLALPLGVTNGTASSTYSVDLTSSVPSSGTATVYIVATPVSLGMNASIISGPPAGNPDYDSTFAPYSAYLLYRDSFSVTATTTAPTGTTLEIGRFSIAQGSTTLGTFDTSKAALLGVADVSDWSSNQIVNAQSADGRYVRMYSDSSAYDAALLTVRSGGIIAAYADGNWYTAQPSGQMTTFNSMVSSGDITAPSWATRLEFYLTAGGGGGSNCQAQVSTDADTNASGGGGAAGATAYGVLTVTGGATVGVVIGSGGAAEATGGTSLLSYKGDTVAECVGGSGSNFSQAANSAGATPGSASGSAVIMNLSAGYGDDGQNGRFTFSGDGGASFWGGGGKAGQGGGLAALSPGSGGGGAYDSTVSGSTYLGGAGAKGILKYRWLP